MIRVLWARKNVFVCFFVVVSIFYLFTMFYGSSRLIGVGYDEGVYLLTAYQHARGQALYTELYLSQPPLLIEFFSGIISAFGANVALLRGIFVLFSLIALLATYGLAKEMFGWKVAVIAVSLLELHFLFALNGRLMNMSMPSLAFAVLAVYFALKWRNSGRSWNVAVSAVCFSISVSLKFLELFFIFPIAFALLAPPFAPRGAKGSLFTFRASLIRALVYIVCFVLPLILILQRYDLKAFISQAVIGLDSRDLFVIAWRRAGRNFGNYYIAKELAFFALVIIGLRYLFTKDRFLFTFVGYGWCRNLFFISSCPNGSGTITLSRSCRFFPCLPDYP